jgi:8-oxo-dGTP pyrophosphatase MutT (NUDIX family)
MELTKRRVAAFAFVESRLILIRTGGAGARIPPKGKTEPGETDVEAALRELREEAGVLGTPRYVSERPVGRYKHVKARSRKGEINDIFVALIDEKDFVPKKAELGREPRLFTRSEAVAQVRRDVVDGLRPSSSGRDLIAAIGIAYAFAEEVRKGRIPLALRLQESARDTARKGAWQLALRRLA